MTTDPGPPVVDESELVVVGAGPAGTACAIAAADAGLSVLLIDQNPFPRDKPCGDGITRPGVAILRHMGLGHVVDAGHPIEGIRLTYRFGAAVTWPYRQRLGRPRAASVVSRLVLDAALVEEALCRGARFLRGRVQGPWTVEGEVVGVDVTTDQGPARVTAGVVVAADGATSRMRRIAGPPRASSLRRQYAVRQYIRTTQQLDPAFNIYGPLFFGGQLLAGYGWLFPLGPFEANVGVGFMSSPGVARAPIKAVLSSFLNDLRHQGQRPLGDVEISSKPFGAPVATDFAARGGETGRILYVGDAAGTVDPLSGEGIAYALQSGEIVAGLAHATLRRRPRVPVHVALARAFPRLVQDVRPVARAVVQLFPTVVSDPAVLPEIAQLRHQELLRSAAQLAANDARLRDLPVLQHIEPTAPDVAEVISGWDGRVRDLCTTELPFGMEMLHRALLGRCGFLLSAVVVAAHASHGASHDKVREAALSLELMEVADLMMMRVLSSQHSAAGSVNAALAAALAQLCLARSLQLGGSMGASFVAPLARAWQRLAAGRLEEARLRSDVSTPLAIRWPVSVGRAMPLYELAARTGSQLAGADPATVGRLERWGGHIGVAARVARDMTDLLLGDGVVGTQAGHDLRAGFYGLPVIHALEEDRELSSHLASPTTSDDADAIIWRIRRTGSLTYARDVCYSSGGDAQLVRAEGERDDRELVAVEGFALAQCETAMR